MKLILARRPDLATTKKKKMRTWKIVDFAVPADYRIKRKECENKDKYLDLARELKKTMEHAGDNKIEILESIYLCTNKWWISNRIISVT